MKRTIIVVVLGAVLFGLVLSGMWTLVNAGAKRTMRREWAHGLGSVEDVPKRHPPQTQNADATRLIALASPLGIELTPAAKRTPDPVLTKISGYVRQEQGKATRDIAPPPAEVAQYLAAHAAELDAVRDHLARANVSWPFDLSKRQDAPLPNLLGHLQLGRVFVARALVHRSWDDLEAAWRLSLPLQSRPETITQLIALAMTRAVNATAWKLSAPAPAWLAEMHAADPVQQFARSAQVEAWIGAELAPAIPFGRFTVTRAVNLQRDLTADLLANQQCGRDFSRVYEEHVKNLGSFGQLFTPNLAGAWRRVYRYRAEREATMNALRIEAGQPIVERSICTDGTWRYADGTLAFSRALPKGEAQEVDLPLTLRVRE